MRHFLLSLTFFYSYHSLFAQCDCDSLAIEKKFQQADYVFIGTVVEKSSNWVSGGWKHVFSVEKSWKQELRGIAVVNTPLEKKCGMHFDAGKRYLVAVDKRFFNYTDRCMGNRPLAEGENVSYSFKEFSPHKNKQHRQNMVWVGFGLLFLTPVLLLAGIFLLKKRK